RADREDDERGNRTIERGERWSALQPFDRPAPTGHRTGCYRFAGEVAAQVPDQFARRGVPSFRILLETLMNNRLEIAADRSVDLTQPLRFVPDDCLEDLIRRDRIVGVENWLEGEQFPERRAETVHIRPRIESAFEAEHLLGAGIARRTDELLGLRQM